MFWDISKPLSYNALFNFIVGMRGVGKTYGFKQWAISDFIKRGNEFVYVRRYGKELLKNDLEKFFTDISSEFPNHSFDVKGKTFYIDKKAAGYAIPLSTSKIKKSVPYPNVNKICFDEFILDKGVYHYLPDEVTNFLELYSTISRDRDVRVFFLSNALSITNPYFNYFNLNIPYEKEIGIYGSSNDILLQVIKESEFVEHSKNTRFGKLIEGTAYGGYAMENEFLRDNKNFVAKKSEKAQYYFTLEYRGKSYGIYVDYKAGTMFVSKNVDPSCLMIYALTGEDHKPNTLYFKGKKPTLLQNLINIYYAGALRFESIAIKNEMNEALRLFS